MNLGKPVTVFPFHKFAYFLEIRVLTEFPNVYNNNNNNNDNNTYSCPRNYVV